MNRRQFYVLSVLFFLGFIFNVVNIVWTEPSELGRHIATVSAIVTVCVAVLFIFVGRAAE